MSGACWFVLLACGLCVAKIMHREVMRCLLAAKPWYPCAENFHGRIQAIQATQVIHALEFVMHCIMNIRFINA